jgi:D-alanyl-D-alanine carboxypeptidase/D-alanyl-D-alanine-endopeptidase (penicillin-binding protein 4)
LRLVGKLSATPERAKAARTAIPPCANPAQCGSPGSGDHDGSGGSFEGGVAAVKQFLLQAGLKQDEFTFLDGSGLSRRDLVTPAATVQLLIYASRQPWGAAFQESLPVGGVDGSLAERFLNTPAGGLVHAKTGSLSHVNALSGYGETKSGRKFVFSIFCNNYNAPASKALTAIDAVVQLLVSETQQNPTTDKHR